MIARLGMGGLPFVNSSIVGRTFHVDRLPHAVLIGEDGTVLSKGAGQQPRASGKPGHRP